MKNQYLTILESMDTQDQARAGNRHLSPNSTYEVTAQGKIATQEEEILRSEISALKIAYSELESFSYSVAHDLRAPLRAICGYASSIREDYSCTMDEEGKRNLQLIMQCATGMTALIEKMLNFSRIGKREVNKTFVDMSEVAANALLEINRVQPNNARVVIHALHPAMGDPALITQVIINLFSNAIKYSSKSANPVVQIRSIKKSKETIYCIEDNGAGFDMKYMDKLFGVFQRLHSSSEFEGTGVGLAIAKRIIEKHDGKIWAEGKEGAGATFYFSLPME